MWIVAINISFSSVVYVAFALYPRPHSQSHTTSAMYPRSFTLPPARPRPPSYVFLSLARTLIPQPPPPLVSSRPLPTNFKKPSPQSESNKLFMEGLIRETETLRAQAKEGGGQKVLDRWKAKGTGKLSVRERSV